MSKPAPVVNCPHCGTPVPWCAAQPYRPFCSERCKRIDLGEWAREGYRVPVQDGETEAPAPPAGA